jgi:pyruvate-ferredoxin/flavodoxin oxidoreductase
MTAKYITVDANQAVSQVAYSLSEVIAIYPITPATPMGEWTDQWASNGKKNLWGAVPDVIEMQSEAGAAGTIHGALQTGALSTTFTASQGLLLMLPNMFKIAGELSPCVIHVAARSLATHALSIFGDHSDVMAARSTGFAMLASSSVQESHDLALISHLATLESRVPFLHFFDGFRTSHEIQKVEQISDDVIASLVDQNTVTLHRERALNPNKPVLRGTAQNPDVFFQCREAANPYYNAIPEILDSLFLKFKEKTGRGYRLFDYVGSPDAESVIIMMGSGCEAAHEAVERLVDEGEKVGLVKVRLFRPFSASHLIAVLPQNAKHIAVLDRTKESGAIGEPLYSEVVTALHELHTSGESPLSSIPKIIGGRYGLSSKEFTPAMVKAVFQNLQKENSKNHFTVGIEDDVTHTSIPIDDTFCTEDDDATRAIFYGLGSDGTVGANKNSIKIIGEATDLNVQGYFVYDSKKSGSVTTSHLRFGPNPIHSTYLIRRANFLACHQPQFLYRKNLLNELETGGTFLLNTPDTPEQIWDKLPKTIQQTLIEKEVKFYVIDALNVAESVGLKRRINTVMQTCFFAISGVLPQDEAIVKIKDAIRKTWGKRGKLIVDQNIAAVDKTLEQLKQVEVPSVLDGELVPAENARQQGLTDFVCNVTLPIIHGLGDELPVSSFPPDGTFPTGTAKVEKRNIASQIPEWDPEICIQCGKCVLECPHSVIRSKLVTEDEIDNRPELFKIADSRFPDQKDKVFTLQIAPEDCTGCTICVEACPVKNKEVSGRKALNMVDINPVLETEKENWDYFLNLSHNDRTRLDRNRIKDIQLMEPLFEFSGACAGCGETPYIKLISQLFGDRMVVANATGCSSIYGGNLPTTPWTKNSAGCGPAWSNSLFEDNAEFGLGMRLAADKQQEIARELLRSLSDKLPDGLAASILDSKQRSEEELAKLRKRIKTLEESLTLLPDEKAKLLNTITDALLHRSVWIVGGDGWAYDIGYGGLDHVLASGHNVNVLVLDTEVYSNTGGQASKSTPRAAVAKFAAGGKSTRKKDLALLATSYGNVYVARIAMGANDAHTVRAILEAESYDGPSLILAYSHCIAHGYDMAHGLDQQKAAVESGHWPLMRYDPRRHDEQQNPFVLDSRPPKIRFEKYAYNETRYRILAHAKPDLAAELMAEAQADVDEKWSLYSSLANSGNAPDKTSK